MTDHETKYGLALSAESSKSSDVDKDVALLNTKTDGHFPSVYAGRCHVHVLCNSGEATFTVSERTFTIKAHDFSHWPADSIITKATYSSDFEADFLLVSRKFLLEYNPQFIWATKGYLYVKENPVFHLNDREFRRIESDFNQFKERLHDKGHIFRREILGRQMEIFLFDLLGIYALEMGGTGILNSTAASMFSRFLDLVSRHNSDNREVAYYADQLCVTPKYLSEVVKKASGKPASYWINSYTLQTVVAMLKSDDLTISQISERMNFYSQSHLSRFVKKMLGVSPTEYRNSLEKK